MSLRPNYRSRSSRVLDCVFKTHFPDDGPEDTRVVSRYEPPVCIEFVRINSFRSIRYFIELLQQKNRTTQAQWQQIITGLSPEGGIFVAGLTDGPYHKRMKMLGKMINHYLKTGEMLKIM